MNIAQILEKTGEKVDLLVMIDGAPSLFHRPMFRDYTRRRIAEGTLRDDVSLPQLKPLDHR
jgi:fatty acid synthase